uniref:Uncharacterized protein n=1 Tax=Crocodylus porosus TaxID=8502 RepID=A0A7M4FUJ2_CROPO
NEDISPLLPWDHIWSSEGWLTKGLEGKPSWGCNPIYMEGTAPHHTNPGWGLGPGRGVKHPFPLSNLLLTATVDYKSQRHLEQKQAHCVVYSQAPTLLDQTLCAGIQLLTPKTSALFQLSCGLRFCNSQRKHYKDTLKAYLKKTDGRRHTPRVGRS